VRHANPDGWLEILHPVNLEPDDPVPAEAISLLSYYFAESIGTMKFASARVKMWMKALATRYSSKRKARL